MKAENLFLRILFALVLSAGFALPAFGVEDSSPVVSKAEWTIGIAMFQVEAENPVLLSSASLLARLIRDELMDIQDHRLTSEERVHLARVLIDDERRKAYASLSSLYHKKDDMFFDPNSDEESIRKQENLISDTKLELLRWESMIPSMVVVPESLPVRLVGPDTGGDIWDIGNADAAAFRKNRNLDVFIEGELVRVGEYFGIRILSYSDTGNVVLWEGAVDEAALGEIATEAGAEARSLILGRPWASLLVDVIPADATISANGRISGVGRWSDTALIPGEILLEMTAPGHLPLVRTVVLENEESLYLELSLEASARRSILVRSEPSGADIRLGSIWMGRTPLSLEVPDRVMSLTLEKEGFQRRTVPFYPDTERFTIPLENKITDPAAELDRARKKLHNSIAWFSLSMAPTIILLGVSQNYANKNFNSTTDQDIQSSYDAYNLTRGLMWGSLSVNVLLLANVFFRLSKYFKAAEALSE